MVVGWLGGGEFCMLEGWQFRPGVNLAAGQAVKRYLCEFVEM